jgi:predicted metal-dependent peptidase
MATWRGLHEEDSRLANLAADHFVNLSLQDTDNGAEFVKMLRVGVKPDPKYRGWSVKQIFDDLKQNPPDEDGQGDGEGDGMDSHDWEQGAGKDPTEAQAQAEEIQRAIRQGEIIRKKIGKGSGDSAGAFDDLLQPKVDWRKVLREFVTETCAGRDESTWRKLNRRFMDEGICMPSMIGTTITELVVGFDTSGSCFNGADMARFVAEITRIIEDIKPNKCRVIYWDTKVVGEQVFEDGQFAVQNLKPKGGGGTDGSVLFDYLRENRINPNAIVQFTDGEIGDWGRSDWPTLWAITSNIRSPYGVTINIKE